VASVVLAEYDANRAKPAFCDEINLGGGTAFWALPVDVSDPRTAGHAP